MSTIRKIDFYKFLKTGFSDETQNYILKAFLMYNNNFKIMALQDLA